mmetsp:Transcript_11813/g.35628  ORF Transcript_11813/g.35628 Transcript_11813/m.35628 type:complete len:142 (-) Transcript_11813:127-552(-)
MGTGSSSPCYNSSTDDLTGAIIITASTPEKMKPMPVATLDVLNRERISKWATEVEDDSPWGIVCGGAANAAAEAETITHLTETPRGHYILRNWDEGPVWKPDSGDGADVDTDEDSADIASEAPQRQAVTVKPPACRAVQFG